MKTNPQKNFLFLKLNSRAAAVAAILLVLNITAQNEVQWSPDGLNGQGNTEALLGTTSQDPLYLITGGEKRVAVDVNGFMKISKLAGDGYRLLYVDDLGNVGTMANRAGSPPEHVCLTSSVPWYEGGNSNVTAGFNVIGPCSNIDFVLQAGSNQGVWIKPSTRVGIGTSSPGAKLEVYDAGNANINHTMIKGDNNGTIESTDGILTLNANNGNNSNAGVFLNTTGQFNINTNTVPSFNIDPNGVATFGYQSNASNSSQLNLNVAGGSSPTNAFEMFDATTNRVNFKIMSNGATFIGQKKVNPSGAASAHANALVQIFGKVACSELVIIDPIKWADYVFDKNYKLKPLSELERYYSVNKHLPEVPSEKEVADNGVNLAEMNVVLLKKVEELTLYVVELNKKIEKLEHPEK